MEYEDFYELLAKDFGVGGLASGNYSIDQLGQIYAAIATISRFDQLGFKELNSAAQVALNVNDDEDRANVLRAITTIQMELLEKGKQ